MSTLYASWKPRSPIHPEHVTIFLLSLSFSKLSWDNMDGKVLETPTYYTILRKSKDFPSKVSHI
jgi:hypothetical protein